MHGDWVSQDVLLALDQGTSSSRVVAYDARGVEVASAQQGFEQIFPQSGWVEHNPEVLWATSLSCLRGVLQRLDELSQRPVALGVTNQRETTILWDRRRDVAYGNAIVWQDRRTAAECARLEAAGHGALVTERTGLRLDPYFSATKAAWLLEAHPEAADAARRGDLCFGTVDAWLIWRLTGGRVHATDATNASRTALFDIVAHRWDPELCDLFGVPMGCLPEVRDSAGEFGETDPGIVGAAIPISGVAGDQQAALVGQACFAEGEAKTTFGTGAFLVLNTGAALLRSRHQLLSTIGYRWRGRTTYALEGSILSAGSTIQWLRDGLGLFTRAAEAEALARSVADTGGVYLVPAFTGLGAPHWNPQARAAIVGLSRGSGRAEIARAGIDSTVYQTHDLIEAVAADGMRPSLLRVDGGMSANDFFLQRLADILAVPVVRAAAAEASAWGAACLAGLGRGVFDSLEQLRALSAERARFMPALTAASRAADLAGWHRALRSVAGAAAD